MARLEFPYVGESTIRKLLDRYTCAASFHAVACASWVRSVGPQHHCNTALPRSPNDLISKLFPPTDGFLIT